MAAIIRLATANDAEQIQAIYAPNVLSTAISFELEPPTVDAMRQRIVQTVQHWPWLVCDYDGEALGYVYAGEHGTRAAYQWSVDVSVYVQAQVVVRASGVPYIAHCSSCWPCRVSTRPMLALRYPIQAVSVCMRQWGFAPSACIMRWGTNWGPGTMSGGGSCHCKPARFLLSR